MWMKNFWFLVDFHSLCCYQYLHTPESYRAMQMNEEKELKEESN